MTLLTVSPRNNLKVASLRSEGKVPAVLYGRKTESLPIFVELIDFMKVWKEVGTSTVFTLKEGSHEYDALIHDIQIHPITEKPVHIDFYIVEKGQTVSVEVPIELSGKAPAIDLGGQVVQILFELEVEGKAEDLPHEINIDISSLTTFDSTITVGDIDLPQGVMTRADKEDVVAIVQMPEEEPEETNTEDISSVEVEKKGKKEE